MKLSKIALACLVATGVTAPQFASADDAFEWHGYARAGTAYESDGNTTIGPSGSNGVAIGRLGNESNGGEWLFIKKFAPENGTKWDVGLMIDEWGNGLGVKQSYAGASNVWESQPNAYVWAGKVFHSRMQQGLTDYYLSIQDGEGTGIKGLDLGFANLELGAVSSGWGGQYAATSKLSDISLGPVNLDIIANYGFTDDSADSVDIDAYLVVTKFSGWGQNFYYRYADNTENSLSWGRVEGLSSHYVSVDGSFALAENTGLEYQVGYAVTDELDDANDRAAANIVIRPTYQWNDIHSTWLEFGYGLVDYDNSDVENSAYKVTVSQNIAVGGVTWARPQIRFYVTAGQEDNNDTKEDLVIAGAMFEAWW